MGNHVHFKGLRTPFYKDAYMPDSLVRFSAVKAQVKDVVQDVIHEGAMKQAVGAEDLPQDSEDGLDLVGEMMSSVFTLENQHFNQLELKLLKHLFYSYCVIEQEEAMARVSTDPNLVSHKMKKKLKKKLHMNKPSKIKTFVRKIKDPKMLQEIGGTYSTRGLYMHIDQWRNLVFSLIRVPELLLKSDDAEHAENMKMVLDLVVDKIFHALAGADDKITYEEFATTLSIALRGSSEEKTELVIRILGDANENGQIYITKQRLVDISHLMKNRLHKFSDLAPQQADPIPSVPVANNAENLVNVGSSESAEKQSESNQAGSSDSSLEESLIGYTFPLKDTTTTHSTHTTTSKPRLEVYTYSMEQLLDFLFENRTVLDLEALKQLSQLRLRIQTNSSASDSISVEKELRNIIISECFGVFETFLHPLFEQIELFMKKDPIYEIQGILRRGTQKEPFFYTINGGVLKEYMLEESSALTAEATVSPMRASAVTNVYILSSCLGVEHPAENDNAFLLVLRDRKKILFEAASKEQKYEWAFTILVYLQEATDYRYNSSYPVHLHTNTMFYVDGKDAYRAMAEAIMSAREEIYLTGWTLTPFIYMLREKPKNFPSNLSFDAIDYRIDILFLRKARQGVQIYLILWNEFKGAGMNLETSMTKQYLEGLHENIHVLLHPEDFLSSPKEFTHHQKSLIIDQRFAFLGGFDICYSRYDDHDHVLTDRNHCNLKFPGSDYVNQAYQVWPKRGTKAANFKDQLDRDFMPRMPWHDIHCSVRGEAALDVAQNFIQRWNHHKDLVKTSDFRELILKQKMPIAPKQKERTRKNSLASILGKRTTEFFQKLHMENLARRTNQAHEAGSNGPASSTIEKPRFYENAPKSATQPNYFSTQSPLGKGPQKNVAFPDIKSPMTATDAITLFPRKQPPQTNLPEISPLYLTPTQQLQQQQPQLQQHPQQQQEDHQKRYGFQCTCQIVRSIARWSGSNRNEQSIYNSIIDLIISANHYIYIENQYFISSTASSSFLRNQFANAILDRIRHAIRTGQTFRVIVVLPLHMDGDLINQASIQQVHKYQQRTILTGKDSMYNQLQQEFPNVDITNYLVFFNLRNYGFVEGNQPVSEQIYVHSKLMIVDDKRVFIGSANLNDRSLIGSRDSELGVIIEDEEFENSRMDGKPYRAGVFAKNLRLRLWKEHLGLPLNSDAQNQQFNYPQQNSPTTATVRNVQNSSIFARRGSIIDNWKQRMEGLMDRSTNNMIRLLDDPIASSTYTDLLLRTARQNTVIYSQVFSDMPTNDIKTINDYRLAKMQRFEQTTRFELGATKEQIGLLKRIQGHLVMMPLYFLAEDQFKKDFQTRLVDPYIFV